MKARLALAVFALLPLLALANPIRVDGQSLIAFGIVAFWALVIESGIATLTVASSGVLIVPAFGTLVMANVAVFLFAFLPLTARVPLALLEPGVVALDTALLKILVALPWLQSGRCVGVTWRRAFVAALLGNAASLFIGVLARNTPWVSPDTGGFE
jgi:hypothetical protein